MADDERRGMEGLVVSSLLTGWAGACEMLGLRDLDRPSSVVEREREGIELSRVGKLLVDILATEVIMADVKVGLEANGEGEDTAQVNDSTREEKVRSESGAPQVHVLGNSTFCSRIFGPKSQDVSHRRRRDCGGRPCSRPTLVPGMSGT